MYGMAKRSVADVYLASGVADPCQEGNLIGHCWAAVLLSDTAKISDFGLNPVDETPWDLSDLHILRVRRRSHGGGPALPKSTKKKINI